MQIPEISNQFTILVAYGTNGFTREHKSAIAELKQLKEIIIFFDGDEPGEESAALLAETLHELLPQADISTIETIKDEDINSIYLKYGAETILQLIEKRTQLFSSFELNLTESLEARARNQDNEPPPSFSMAQPSPEVNLQITTSSNLLDTVNPNKIITETPLPR